MVMNMKRIIGFSSMLVSLWSCGAQHSAVKQDETVILFSTSGYLNSGQQWVVPLHGWIFEYEHDSLWREATVRVLLNSLELEDDEVQGEQLFRERGWLFLVDNERGKELRIDIRNNSVYSEKSKPNGHFVGEAQLPASGELAPQSPLWISYQVYTGDQRRFVGESQLLPPEGVSIISDIDDTIKDSHVADKKALLANTFLKEFVAVDGMAGLYQQWQSQGAAFHYLSASPWQLYPALNDFIRDQGFPKGDFSLRYFRVKDRSFYELFASPFEYKTNAIEDIIRRYPQRKFALIGDSTESDPEVYAHIAKRYPNQVIRILIRNAAHKDLQEFEPVFSGLSRDLWQVFEEPAELATINFAAR